MKITLLAIAKTEEAYLKEGIAKYLNRLKHYINFKMLEIPDLKNNKHLTEKQQKNKEAELLLKQINNQDVVILLDEKGKQWNSIAFSEFINKKMVAGTGHLIFVIGGPYGFDESLYQRANGLLSLSEMTFSHQMIRLFFVEQLYRAFSILKGEPYHHA